MASAAPSSTTYASGATGPVDLRILHYNDVYHISSDDSKGKPDAVVGGAARFVSLVKHYASAPEYSSQPNLLTFFSGDAFNPSRESSVTKGRHMVPILNEIGTTVACLGNHDLDFGVEQLQHLAVKCKFPWLCANVEDPALGEGVSIAGLQKTIMLESSNGIKVGVIGLVEREWLDTINSLPPNLKYTSATEMAKRLVPGLREQGAEIVIAVSHQREPNDVKLANQLPEGLIDIVLGGHDHHYAHEVINGTHVIRSGCDFKTLSYIEARRKPSGKGWDFDIVCRSVTAVLPEDPTTAETVAQLTSALDAKLKKPVGYTAIPLDSRFSTVRCAESNIANFVCDLMRFYYHADCTLMAGGTIRGDKLYPQGVITLGDITNCFPFEDPVVVIRVPGKAIISAIENGLSKLPALEGRFPHTSNVFYVYDPERPAGDRIVKCRIGDEPLDPEKNYNLATRGYMAKGKDGYTALSEMVVETIVDDENGILISMILTQYFLSLKIVGRWNKDGVFKKVFGGLKRQMTVIGELEQTDEAKRKEEAEEDGEGSSDEEEFADIGIKEDEKKQNVGHEVIGRLGKKWKKLTLGKQEEVDWTSCIKPKVEGRIRTVQQAREAGEDV